VKIFESVQLRASKDKEFFSFAALTEQGSGGVGKRQDLESPQT